MKRTQIGYWGVFLITGLALGIPVFLLTRLGLISNPTISLQIPLSSILLILSSLIMLLISLHIFLLYRLQRQEQETIQQIQIENRTKRHRFLRRLDHELKNPLTAIRAGLINITSDQLSDYVYKEAEAVNSQAIRISQLVADLRKIATLDELELETSSVQIADLLQDVIEIVQSSNNLEARNLLLITPSAPWPLPIIEGDPDLLLLAIHNLVDNSVKFSCSTDTIEVRASDEGKYVSIEVADTGCGIPQDEIDRVWDELYRGSQSHGIPGSGLGLPLVKTIIEKHGGKVTTRSIQGQGSVFCLYLPVP